jgi:hypothetical protein
MKKKTLRVLTSAMTAAMLLNGCGSMGKADADDNSRFENIEEIQFKQDTTDQEETKKEPEEIKETKEEPKNETSAETSDQAGSENLEIDSLAEGTDRELPDEGTEVSFRGWKSNQGEDGFFIFFSFEDSDYDLDFDPMISLDITSEQRDYLNANQYEEFEISFIYTEDMKKYSIHNVEPVSIKVVPEDTSAAASYSPDTDPLRGLVADDVLDKYRATNPVKDPDSIFSEGRRLGHWVQKTIAKDGFSEELMEMGHNIGSANEYCFGTDIGNNFDNNFAYYYAVYFSLKDYYTSDGTRSTDAYEDLVEDNEYLGNGDPARIDELYEELKGFITICNNIIREK